MSLNIVIGIISGLGLACLFLAVSLYRRRRRILGSLQLGFAFAVMGLAGLMWGMSASIYTYKQLTEEQAVAEVEFVKIGSNHYQANVHLPSGTKALFELKGDEWQIDSRMIKWHNWANVLGLKPMYRLERISGRYRDINKEKSEKRSVHPLSTSPGGLDLWQVAYSSQDWLPWADAIYGTAAYVPMEHKARFKVSLSISGLVVRPVNQEAKQSIKNWR